MQYNVPTHQVWITLLADALGKGVLSLVRPVFFICEFLDKKTPSWHYVLYYFLIFDNNWICKIKLELLFQLHPHLDWFGKLWVNNDIVLLYLFRVGKLTILCSLYSIVWILLWWSIIIQLLNTLVNNFFSFDHPC